MTADRIEIYFSTDNAELVANLYNKSPDAVIFPEVTPTGLPRTPKQLLQMLPELIRPGVEVYTVSEHVILYAQQLVRIGHIAPHNLIMWHYAEDREPCLIGVDTEGDFTDDIAGGFYPERLELLKD